METPDDKSGASDRERWLWALRDSNPGPTDYESAALTTELRALKHVINKFILNKLTMKLHNFMENKAEYRRLNFRCIVESDHVFVKK